ncbi:hypothetical protein VTN77DRAFT_3139 [Rasamsonia byssochlamydoides]|uniref:uncharacterized protein n=1 Tax=Rasamsonia byssochlamydoides TaxID=89139 RepID=UPI00374451C3
MRPPRLLLLLFCFIFLPILLTCLSLITAEPHRGADANAPLAGRTSRLRALFSFNAPASLFPPSAIISLTDDNSTFFLARPAAFGPLLPAKGLSGQLWIGSGFGDDTLRKGDATAGSEGELGCSDVPGWGEKDSQLKQDKGTKETEKKSNPQPVTNHPSDAGHSLNRRSDPASESAGPKDGNVENPPSADDGTDDHLHHPLPGSTFPDPSNSNGEKPTHADIQSLQESAEIAGKIVLLSRGGCGFLEKVKWVQRRGGVALIVGDDTKGGSLVTMYARGDTSNITIPSVFTSYTTAHLLSSLIPPREKSRSDDALKIGHGESIVKSSTNKGKQGSGSSPTTKATSTPTSQRTSKQDGALSDASSASDAGSGFLHTVLSLVGLGSDKGYGWHLPEDSRRPPSSGSIDWVLVDDWEEDETSGKVKGSADTKDSSKKGGAQQNESKKSGSKPANFDGDGFEIGVQDWRDPDLVPPKSSSLPKPSTGPGKKTQGDNGHDGNKNSQSGSRLKGGSITPGSGEYARPDKSTGKSDKKGSDNAGVNAKSGSSQVEENWFSRHFHWAQDTDPEPESSATTQGSRQDGKDGKSSQSSTSADKLPGEGDPDFDGHEDLWVTLTPTSMSTSPFFDTLLVLVVSPLITLTVVYALLLIRSRIRRRRWRAPKSVVDRLPVRTYHTIPSQSSTASSTPRSPSPGSATSTSPLLGSRSQSASGRARPRSQTISGVVNPTEVTREAAPSSGEKQGSGSNLWRRKYTGRQVECVVCLEEYIDGQSRVMSLPCGHEFHAECITPWLTTRRRTCPICKGDVVRSMSQRDSGAVDSRAQNEQNADDTQPRAFDSHNDSASGALPPDDSSLEHGEGPDAPLLAGNTSSAPQSSWRNFASLSFSALSGDTIWHSARTHGSR